MQKISILYLIDQMKNMGGAEGNLLNVITNINQNRFTYFLYTFQLEFPMKGILEKKNIKCLQTLLPTTLKGLLKFLTFSIEIRSKKVNILHTYFEGSDIWGTFLAKLAGIPVIISSKRDMGISKSKKILTAYRFINPFVTKIISVSEAVKRQVNLQEKVNLNKIVTIYNGVDSNKYINTNQKKALKLHLKLNTSAAIVGVLANIKPIKGIEYFIYAASKVQKQFPHTQFIVIGVCLPNIESITYHNKLKSLIKELKLENSFFFLGGRSDIHEILSIMDVSVLPSLSEGFSNTVIESMSVGKPVVVTDVGGNSEAVIHGKTGFVVPPRNINKLTEAISLLLADKKLAKSMGKAGRRRIKEHFSIEKMINEIENLYITTINNNDKLI
jgi:glycosyltransferase involved in cell wall biosynthesis